MVVVATSNLPQVVSVESLKGDEKSSKDVPVGKKREPLHQDVIMKVMDHHGINPGSVTGQMRKWTHHFNGRFVCPKCGVGKSWSSNWCWVSVDLRAQKIRYRFHQKCSDCLTPVAAWISKQEMNRVMHAICIRFQKRWNDPEPPTSRRNSVDEPPNSDIPPSQPSRRKHRPDLCEKCGYNFNKPLCYEKYATIIKNLNKVMPGDLPEF